MRPQPGRAIVAPAGGKGGYVGRDGRAPAGERPPEAFTDLPTALSPVRYAALGRAAQELVGSLDGLVT